MARPRQDVTDAELAVLQALWERGPSSRRQLADALYPRAGPAAYTTVQKLLERLEAKGCVTRQPGPGPRTFAAAVSRDQLISRRLLDVADKLCAGSLTPLLTNLVQVKPLSARQLQELRELLDGLSGQPPPPKGRR
jgi:BlaI family transcriptional regulator, penicillinase repressor